MLRPFQDGGQHTSVVFPVLILKKARPRLSDNAVDALPSTHF